MFPSHDQVVEIDTNESGSVIRLYSKGSVEIYGSEKVKVESTGNMELLAGGKMSIYGRAGVDIKSDLEVNIQGLVTKINDPIPIIPPFLGMIYPAMDHYQNQGVY